MRKLLVSDPSQRLTVGAALAHPWLVWEGEVLHGRSSRLPGAS